MIKPNDDKESGLSRSFDALSTPNFRHSFTGDASAKNGISDLPLLEKASINSPSLSLTSFLGIPLKYLSLAILVFHNSLLVLLLQYSRSHVKGPMYISSTAVFMMEIVKVFGCLIMIFIESKSVGKFFYNIHTVFANPSELILLSIPSGVYAVQNNLLYTALSNLDATTFQVTYQLKIMTTALFSVVMLNKNISTAKWVSLIMLMIGVALVQLHPVSSDGSSKSTVESKGNSDYIRSNELKNEKEYSGRFRKMENFESNSNEEIPKKSSSKGFISVLLASISSGFAGVYFEKILKNSQSNIWVRNIQLGIFGIFFSFVTMVINDGEEIRVKGMFYGYNTLTAMVIFNQAIGGLIVAVVVKYADNILKGFATSFSIILSGIVSAAFLDFHPSLLFLCGSGIVMFSVYLYGKP